MKLLLAAIVLLTAATVRAQYLPATPTEEASESRAFYQATPSTQGLLTLQLPKANTINVNGVSYSGSLVEMVKTRQPLQMVNPFASAADYGTALDNTVIDPITRRGTGLKLFAVQF